MLFLWVLRYFSFFILFCFFRVESEAYGGSQARGPIRATATATEDPSHIYDLHHSSRQRQILNPQSEARNQTRNLMVPSRICFHCATMGTPVFFLIFIYLFVSLRYFSHFIFPFSHFIFHPSIFYEKKKNHHLWLFVVVQCLFLSFLFFFLSFCLF